ncbi:hypothetical protein H4R33_002239 [Dimargaris cristalligena]|nr:hypothetical protein H4R33_002239 [Dimargaris cristalligena]
MANLARQPSHDWGHRLIRHLDNQGQLRLARVCHALRPAITASYQFSVVHLGDIPLQPPALTRFITRYRPSLHSLFIRLPEPSPSIPPYAWLRAVCRLFSEVGRLDHVDWYLRRPASWPAVARCLEHLAPASPRRLTIHLVSLDQQQPLETLPSYADLVRHYFTEALYARLARIRSIELYVEGRSPTATDTTDQMLQMLAPFSGMRELRLYLPEPDDRICQELRNRYPHLTRLALYDSLWNFTLLLTIQPRRFSRLVSLKLSCGSDEAQCQALGDLVATDYPHLRHLELDFPFEPETLSAGQKSQLRRLYDQPWPQINSLAFAKDFPVMDQIIAGIGTLIVRNFPRLRNFSMIHFQGPLNDYALILNNCHKLKSFDVLDFEGFFLPKILLYTFHNTSLSRVDLHYSDCGRGDLERLKRRVPNLQEVCARPRDPQTISDFQVKYPHIYLIT